MALVIQQPGTPDRFCLFDDDAGTFLATDQTASDLVALLVPRLVALGRTPHGARGQAGKLLAQARRYAAEGPARDPLWQVAKDGAATPEARAWVATVEAAAAPVVHRELRRRFAIVGMVPVDGRPGEMVTVYLNAGPNAPAVWLGVLDYLVHEENAARWLQVLHAELQFLRPGGPVVQDIHAAEVSLTRVVPRMG